MNQLTERDAFLHGVIPKIQYFKESLCLCKQLIYCLVLNCCEANEDLSFKKGLLISFCHQQHAVHLVGSISSDPSFICPGVRKCLMYFAFKHQFLSLSVEVYCSLSTLREIYLLIIGFYLA